MNYYLQVVDAVAKFFHKNRLIVDENNNIIPIDELKDRPGKKFLIATPEDNYLAWIIYGQQFVESCLEMNLTGRQILTVFPKIMISERVDGSYEPKLEETMTETEIIEGMRADGVILKRGEVREKLNELLITGYIDMFEGGMSGSKKKRYYKTQMAANLLDREDAIDWDTLMEISKKYMGEEFPKQLDEYINRYCDPDVTVIHPFTGKKVKVLKKANKQNIINDTKPADNTIENILNEIGGEKNERNTTQRTFDMS